MKSTAFYLAVSLILTGIVFGALSVQEWQKEKIRTTKYERTLGRVVDVRPIAKGKTYPVIGFYALDSQKVLVHARQEVSRFSSYELGDVVEIYYDIINPDDTHIVRYEWFWISFLSFTSIAFVFGGIIWIILIWLRSRRREWLTKNGTLLEGIIQSVVRDPQISLQGEAAFIILCEWKQNEEDNPMLFRSEPLTTDPSPYLQHIETLPIYIDLQNPENYWVDISFIRQEQNQNIPSTNVSVP